MSCVADARAQCFVHNPCGGTCMKSFLGHPLVFDWLRLSVYDPSIA
jgi:hypothetical protein